MERTATVFLTATLAVVAVILLSAPLHAALTIRQDKDGRLVLSNTSRVFALPTQRSMTPVSNGARVRGVSAVPAAMRAKIRQLASHHGVREDLVLAVGRAESSFNPFAVSPKGAVGVMQLMRDTASQYGVANRFNVDENLEAGVRHLKMLYLKYSGNISLTLAAYNAGEEAVKKYNGVPPYRETRDYIRRVMNFMGMAPRYTSLTPARSTLFRYTTAEGRVIITDSLPRGIRGSIQLID